MKKKIEQLLNGKFEYEQPQLLFSKEKLTLTMKAGEKKEAKFMWERRTTARSEDMSLLPAEE